MVLLRPAIHKVEKLTRTCETRRWHFARGRRTMITGTWEVLELPAFAGLELDNPLSERRREAAMSRTRAAYELQIAFIGRAPPHGKLRVRCIRVGRIHQ